jgi:hypothetical protein
MHLKINIEFTKILCQFKQKLYIYIHDMQFQVFKCVHHAYMVPKHFCQQNR